MTIRDGVWDMDGKKVAGSEDYEDKKASQRLLT